MKTTKQPTAKYFAALALKTRAFGHCYVHSGNRAFSNVFGDIEFRVSGWGRSLQSKGHKYKVHALRNGKPVSTKELQAI